MKKIAAIVGATGGFGMEFANQLSGKNFDLILIDISKSRIDELANKITRSNDTSVETIEANLTDQLSINTLAAELATRNLDMLVYAAGYGEKKLFKDEKIQATMNMISVHTLATVQLIHAIIPNMLINKKGSIVVISSLSSFIPAKGSSIYSATKAFLNVFLESIYMEVHKQGIKVQSLCPGLTKTSFHTEKDITRYNKLGASNLWMEASQVVKISLQHLEGDAVICIPGFLNKVIRKLIPLIPRKIYYRILERLSK